MFSHTGLYSICYLEKLLFFFLLINFSDNSTPKIGEKNKVEKAKIQ